MALPCSARGNGIIWRVSTVSAAPSAPISLDDLYIMTSQMYSHRNEERAVTATFAHFVEVSAALTASARRKRRDELDMTGALCKALGWFFPLMAKLNVLSVEELVFRKYPYVCPYCRSAPHNERECKLVRGTESTVDHAALREQRRNNAHLRPVTLDEWRDMFDRIYPRQLNDAGSGRSAIGLFEELGELAEAIRVFHRYPKYLAGEAADVFSYLMAIANEHSMLEEAEGRPGFSLQREYLRRYPGICTQCGYHICVCPPLPEATVGRLAKELDLHDSERIFGRNLDDLPELAGRVAERVISQLGGYSSLLQVDADFPFDRGDANRNLVLLCLQVADAMQTEDPTAAGSLRSAAFRIGSDEAPAGSPKQRDAISAALASITAIPGAVSAIEAVPPLVVSTSEGGRLKNPRWRVLVATASPLDDIPLHVGRESREIAEAIRRSQSRDGIRVEFLQATRISDLRRRLVESDFDLLFLSGHGGADGPTLENEEGIGVTLSVESLRSLVDASTVECVVLNSCYSAELLATPIGSVTVGMFDTVDDEVAIRFAQGFFDGLGAGREISRCIEEGRLAVQTEIDGANLPFVVLSDRT